MSFKKIIFGVIIATLALVLVIYFIQRIGSKEGNVSQGDDKKKVNLYKLTEDNCKLGVYSIEGEVVDRDFYRICSGNVVANINPETCKFEDCPVKNEISTSDWRLYTNEKYKFSIKYPNGWEVSVNEPENALKKLEVLFSNKKCFDENLINCPDGFYGYRIIFYQNSVEQSKTDSGNVKYYEKTSNEVESIKLFSGENIFLYINNELNESNFKDNMNMILPGAQTVLSKNGYSVYAVSDFRGKVEALDYFKASIKTFGFK